MTDIGVGRLDDGSKGDEAEVVEPGGKERWVI